MKGRSTVRVRREPDRLAVGLVEVAGTAWVAPVYLHGRHIGTVSSAPKRSHLETHGGTVFVPVEPWQMREIRSAFRTPGRALAEIVPAIESELSRRWRVGVAGNAAVLFVGQGEGAA